MHSLNSPPPKTAALQEGAAKRTKGGGPSQTMTGFSYGGVGFANGVPVFNPDTNIASIVKNKDIFEKA